MWISFLLHGWDSWVTLGYVKRIMQDRERWNKGLVREWGFCMWLYRVHESLESICLSSKEDRNSQEIETNNQAKSWIKKLKIKWGPIRKYSSEVWVSVLAFSFYHLFKKFLVALINLGVSPNQGFLWAILGFH